MRLDRWIAGALGATLGILLGACGDVPDLTQPESADVSYERLFTAQSPTLLNAQQRNIVGRYNASPKVVDVAVAKLAMDLSSVDTTDRLVIDVSPTISFVLVPQTISHHRQGPLHLYGSLAMDSPVANEEFGWSDWGITLTDRGITGFLSRGSGVPVETYSVEPIGRGVHLIIHSDLTSPSWGLQPVLSTNRLHQTISSPKPRSR